jgi:hypothetical protein
MHGSPSTPKRPKGKPCRVSGRQVPEAEGLSWHPVRKTAKPLAIRSARQVGARLFRCVVQGQTRRCELTVSPARPALSLGLLLDERLWISLARAAFPFGVAAAGGQRVWLGVLECSYGSALPQAACARAGCL